MSLLQKVKFPSDNHKILRHSRKKGSLLGFIRKSARLSALYQITLIHNLQSLIRKPCTSRTLKCFILLRLSMKILLSFLTSLVANGLPPPCVSTGISWGDLLTSLMCAKSHTQFFFNLTIPFEPCEEENLHSVLLRNLPHPSVTSGLQVQIIYSGPHSQPPSILVLPSEQFLKFKLN